MLEFNATFLIAMFSFVVFIMIMNAIFYRPILEIIRKRESYINSNYEDSKRFKADAEEYNTTRASKLEQTQEKCRHEFRTAINEAQEAATKELQTAREHTKQEIQARKEQLYIKEDELNKTIEQEIVKDLAVSITEKILGSKVKITD